MNFSDWLRKEIQDRNWSQAEFARQSKLSTASVTRLLSGKRGVGETAIAATARAFSMPLETVFRAAGMLPPVADDPWVNQQAYKLALLDELHRDLAENLLDSLLHHQEKDQVTKQNI